jgi:hypothetical protein
LAAEVDDYIARFTGERDANGRRLVVRNGSHQPREVLTSAGAVETRAPRANDRRVDPDTVEQARFSSAILPAWCRKTPKITGPRHGRRSARVLGRATRGVPDHAGAALLVPQDRQRARRPPEVRASRGEKGPGRDAERRRPSPRPRRREQLQGRLRGQIQQGRREDHRRPRGTTRVL